MITSSANPRVRLLRELLAKSKVRRREDAFVAEGIRMVSETPASRLLGLYVSESFMKMPAQHRGMDLREAVVLSDSLFNQVCGTQTPQGIMAVVRQRHMAAEEILSGRCPLILFLENIQDPGNLGTLIRTAEGAGVSGVIMSRDTVDIYNPKTVRATMGSLYRVPFAYVDDLGSALAEAAGRGIVTAAAFLGGSVVYDAVDYTKPTGLVIGNEGNGLRKETAERCALRVHIPMAGSVESLNAAVAGAVLMYEAARQRRA